MNSSSSYQLESSVGLSGSGLDLETLQSIRTEDEDQAQSILEHFLALNRQESSREAPDQKEWKSQSFV